MKGFRLLLLVLAICLASGVKAQFYDGPDDIYYYVRTYTESEETALEFVPFVGPQRKKTGKIIKHDVSEGDADVLIFNFDGKKAVELTNLIGARIHDVKQNISKNPNFYEEKVETTDYDWNYVSSSSKGIVYMPSSSSLRRGYFSFSKDRSILVNETSWAGASTWAYYKRVDKSFFKVGRSRTPSNSLHE